MKAQAIKEINKPMRTELVNKFFAEYLKPFFMNMKAFGKVHFKSDKFFIIGTKPSSFILKKLPVAYRRFIDDVHLITKRVIFNCHTETEKLCIVDGKFFGLGSFRMIMTKKEFKNIELGTKPFYYLILVPSITFLVRLWIYNTAEIIKAQWQAITLIIFIRLTYIVAKISHADYNIRETEAHMRDIEAALVCLALDEKTKWAHKYMKNKIKPLDF